MKRRKIKKIIKKEEGRVKREWKSILFNLILYAFSLVITVLFYRNVLLTTILLSILSIIGLVKWKSWITLGIFFFGVIAGPIFEVVAINYGVWSYSIPSFFNIPFWLFILWGVAAAFIYQIALEAKKLVHAK